MKEYTKEQFKNLKDLSITHLENYAEKLIQDYENYLKELYQRDYQVSVMLNLAFEKKDECLQELLSFVDKEYPKSESIFLNGLHIYSVETMINIEMMSKSFEIHRKLDNLFSDWRQDLDDDNP